MISKPAVLVLLFILTSLSNHILPESPPSPHLILHELPPPVVTDNGVSNQIIRIYVGDKLLPSSQHLPTLLQRTAFAASPLHPASLPPRILRHDIVSPAQAHPLRPPTHSSADVFSDLSSASRNCRQKQAFLHESRARPSRYWHAAFCSLGPTASRVSALHAKRRTVRNQLEKWNFSRSCLDWGLLD